MAFQLQACREVGELLGVASFASEVYEADDLLGSLMAPLLAHQQPIALLTRDKDLGQLLQREQDFLWHRGGKDKEGERWYAADIEAKFGVRPDQLIDYLALVGDKVDDIPGVPGVGQKTAQALLARGENIEGIFAQLDQLPQWPIRGAAKLVDKLSDSTEQIALSRALATIVCDLPLIDAVEEIALQLVAAEPLLNFVSVWGSRACTIKYVSFRINNADLTGVNLREE